MYVLLPRIAVRVESPTGPLRQHKTLIYRTEVPLDRGTAPR